MLTKETLYTVQYEVIQTVVVTVWAKSEDEAIQLVKDGVYESMLAADTYEADYYEIVDGE